MSETNMVFAYDSVRQYQYCVTTTTTREAIIVTTHHRSGNIGSAYAINIVDKDWHYNMYVESPTLTVVIPWEVMQELHLAFLNNDKETIAFFKLQYGGSYV